MVFYVIVPNHWSFLPGAAKWRDVCAWLEWHIYEISPRKKNIDYENGGYAKEGTMMALSCGGAHFIIFLEKALFLKGQVIFDNDDQEQENKVD